MAVVVNKEVTTTEVAAVSFGFFRYNEIRKLSVTHVHSPLLYDAIKRPVDHGIYDLAMGPMDPLDSCLTCGLMYGHCPGHFGHIELMGPVYNPLTFTSLYKLLRCTCLHCFNVKMADAEMEKFTEKLKRLSGGDLAGAAAMSTRRLSKAEKEEEEEDLAEDLGDGLGELAGSVDMDWSPDQPQENVDPNRRMWRSRKSRPSKLETSALSEAMSELISDFLARMPTLQCANCKAHNPSIIREGHSRFYLGVLDPKKVATNEFNSVPIAGKKDLLGIKSSETPDTDFDEVVSERKAKNAAKEPEPSAAMKKRGRMLGAKEVMEIVRRVWPRAASMLSPVFACDAPGLLGGAPTLPVGAALDVFFLKAVSVPPNKFRPPSFMNGVPFEHPQNTAYGKIIQINNDLRSLFKQLEERKEGLASGNEAQVEAALTDMDRTETLLLGLQNAVNSLLDSTTADGNTANATPGVRQGLEKKEGLFRKNMMGKRVNFAARSVISPDPYIATGEIGIPPYFALRLSFPERVTPWNVAHLREMVTRGAKELGGAVAIEDEVGRVVSLAPLSQQKRIAIGKALLTRDQAGQTGNKGAGGERARTTGAGPGKTVYRHVQNGDLMLTNRQPTLHKPGLMAHRVRILQGERTIRMHYANCNTFNADFDGDEINLHLPQDHLGRTEGYGLVHADRQFLLPTSGTPARGLIQDHVGAGVLLTTRDTFLTRAEYGQLVWTGCGPHTNDEEITFNEDVDVPVPAVLRPRELFTGKQVISTIIKTVLKGLPPMTLKHASKVPAEYFGGKAAGESEVHLFENTLLTGCLDKAVYGNFGIIHGVQELYGPETAGVMLSAFSRVLTGYLQMRGFSCGIDDLLLVKAAEAERAAIVSTAEAAALKASADLVGHPEPPSLDADTKGTWEAKERELRMALAVRYSSNPKTGAMHDMKSSGALHPLSSSIVKACLPGGQQKPFPHNCLSLMTVSGAKGSLVNFSQISCLLGQQELEGRRVPRMASGRTLPCFAPYDAGARSCGFIGDRFLTGLRPQEFYFHCMAGREGLVDTTVKTSRSGYLQRCLVKNLECLRVHYDYSVRNDTDGSIVQFQYGDDGLGIESTAYLNEYGFLARNIHRLSQTMDPSTLTEASKHSTKLMAHEMGIQLANERRQRLKAKQEAGRDSVSPDAALPVMAQYSPGTFGCVSESFADSLGSYIREDPDVLLHAPASSGRKAKRKRGGRPRTPGDKSSGLLPKHPPTFESWAGETYDLLDPDRFQKLLQFKFLCALAPAGEAVGVLAAQSVGEPSTQMTLNTFHMAGRGEANVTLGIPRLREILMTAAPHIKTPVMNLPLLPGKSMQDGQDLANRMRKLHLAEVLISLEVEQKPFVSDTFGGFQRQYWMCLHCHPMKSFPPELELTFEEVADTFTKQFLPKLKATVNAELAKAGASGRADAVFTSKLSKQGGAAPAADLADEAVPTTVKARKSEKEDEDENIEDNDEFQEGKLRFAGGRGEKATYDAGDDEDKEIEAAARKEAAVKEGDLDQDEDDEGAEAGSKSAATPAAERSVGGIAPQNKAMAPEGKGRKKGGSKVQDISKGQAMCSEEDGMCTAILGLPLDSPPLLMQELAEAAAAKSFIRYTQGIDACYVVEPDKATGTGPKVQTDGLNFGAAWANSDIIDLYNVTTNDVAAVLNTFGVEAARAAIVHEVGSVFGAYGIAVNARHLSLIADFMTSHGGYRACNRMGIESSTSPFLKISFETASQFLTNATLHGLTDDLSSPASRIVLGQVVGLGTGCPGIIQHLKNDT